MEQMTSACHRDDAAVTICSAQMIKTPGRTFAVADLATVAQRFEKAAAYGQSAHIRTELPGFRLPVSQAVAAQKASTEASN